MKAETSSKGLVYIQGPAYYEPTASVFKEKGYEITRSLIDSDIVVLTGGADINPAIYKEDVQRGTYFNTERDQVDVRAAELGHKAGKFLAGICRGAQLLNCMPNGGKLWQDVNNHNGHHPVFDFIEKKWYPDIISVHHQQMIPTEDAVIVAAANEATFKHNPGQTYRRDKPELNDIEVLWYPKTRSLCYQAHPEFGHRASTAYFFNLMDRYYHGNSETNQTVDVAG